MPAEQVHMVGPTLTAGRALATDLPIGRLQVYGGGPTARVHVLIPEAHAPHLTQEPSPAMAAMHAALCDVARHFIELMGIRTLVVEGPSDNPGLLGVWLDSHGTIEAARSAAQSHPSERIRTLFTAACDTRERLREPWSVATAWRGRVAWSWLTQAALLGLPESVVASVEDAAHYEARMRLLRSADDKMCEVRSGLLPTDCPSARTLAMLRELASDGDSTATVVLGQLREEHAAAQRQLRQVAIRECNELVAEQLVRFDRSALVCYGASHIDDLVEQLTSLGCGVVVWHEPTVWTNYLNERGTPWSYEEVLSPDAEFRHELSHFDVPER